MLLEDLKIAVLDDDLIHIDMLMYKLKDIGIKDIVPFTQTDQLIGALSTNNNFDLLISDFFWIMDMNSIFFIVEIVNISIYL